MCRVLIRHMQHWVCGAWEESNGWPGVGHRGCVDAINAIIRTSTVLYGSENHPLLRRLRFRVPRGCGAEVLGPKP